MPEESLDLDLISASLRSDISDVGAFVESLAVKLEGAVPGRTRVDRRRSGMRGPKRVRRIEVDLGDARLELDYEGGRLASRRARLSGGIVLKREEVDLDAWVATLGAALADEARRSETTRQALERLLI